MTRTWRYFLTFPEDGEPADPDAVADSGRAAVYRLPDGAPVAMLQALSYPEEVWTKSDLLLKASWQGPDQYVAEITPARYQELMARWVDIGRIRTLPADELPPPAPDA